MGSPCGIVSKASHVVRGDRDDVLDSCKSHSFTASNPDPSGAGTPDGLFNISNVEELKPLYDPSFDGNLEESLVGEFTCPYVDDNIYMSSYGQLQATPSDLERNLAASSGSSYAGLSDSSNTLESAGERGSSTCLANRCDQSPNIEPDMPSALGSCSPQISVDRTGQPDTSCETADQSYISKGQNASTDTALLNIRSASFAMRERVYMMAQSKASTTRNVIVIFGAGRFQEWRQMMVGNFSYIAVDPMVDVTGLCKKMTDYSVQPYDFSTTFHSQMMFISKRGSTVLWARCKSEDFIAKARPIQIMSLLGIPAVFSFSVSFHIPIIKTLVFSGVSVFGCGYVHDAMPACGVGCASVVMRPAPGSRDSIREVVSIFGDATYVEPFLGRDTVPGLFPIRDVMPSIWKTVDSSTVFIMERAVILCA